MSLWISFMLVDMLVPKLVALLQINSYLIISYGFLIVCHAGPAVASQFIK
jgi:hypothetical protein